MTPLVLPDDSLDIARRYVLQPCADGRGTVLPLFAVQFPRERGCCPICAGIAPSSMINAIVPDATGDPIIDATMAVNVRRLREIVLAVKEDPVLDRFVGLSVSKEPPRPGLFFFQVLGWSPAAVLVARMTDQGATGLAEAFRTIKLSDIPMWVQCPSGNVLYGASHAMMSKGGDS